MLRTTVLALFALLALTAAGASAKTSAASAGRMFQLPALQYNVSALEPVVNTQTMTFHHGSHHAAYVRNLNAALNGSFSGIDDLSRLLLKVGKRVWPSAQETAIRNQGGGHWNHAMFWKVMAAPNSSVTMESAISPALRAAIDATFGNLTNMQAEFNAAANTRFGSGWAWLCVQRPYAKRQLRIVSTANQDNPIMPVVSPKWPCVPILGNDVWEHAYYLRWGPSRAGYVTAWWSIVNWQQVSANYEAAMARKIGYADIAVDY